MKSSLLVGPCPFTCKAPSVFNEVIYVDGGSKHMEQIGTGIIVGDGDSSAPHIKMDIELNPLKNESDLYHALTHAKYQNIQAWGFLGHREDHQLSNLFEAFNFLEDKNNVEINFENQWKVFSRGHRRSPSGRSSWTPSAHRPDHHSRLAFFCAAWQCSC